MKRTIANALLACALLFTGAALTGAVTAGEKGGQDLAEMAKAIRDGEIDVGKQLDMDKKKGRFHVIHSDTVGLECEGCHVGKQYAKDYLLVGRTNAERQAVGAGKGEKSDVLDRSVCLGCHKTGGVATVWYHTADK